MDLEGGSFEVWISDCANAAVAWVELCDPLLESVSSHLHRAETDGSGVFKIYIQGDRASIIWPVRCLRGPVGASLTYHEGHQF
jgi:hypothetical protein